jgi:hypothetical protein
MRIGIARIMMKRSTDLAAEVFAILRREFFDAVLRPKVYGLRDKRNTQDDPFDEALHGILKRELPAGVECEKATGPLITPDMVVLRTAECVGVDRGELKDAPGRIVGIEVKKLERTDGKVARQTGLDYNTTPPCGTVRVYDQDEKAVDIRGFYLFVCQEQAKDALGKYMLTSLVFCDGSLLNDDFDYYLSIVGERTKKVGLGTFGDGADRCRPMLIFANPLGCRELERSPALVHQADKVTCSTGDLVRIGTIRRQCKAGGSRTFYCYGCPGDYGSDSKTFDLVDPFPTPKRKKKTQPRGKFRLSISTEG